jgi:hypothetical protein
MQYLSYDIETTGLEPGLHQMLSLALVLEDTSKPLSELQYLQLLIEPPINELAPRMFVFTELEVIVMHAEHFARRVNSTPKLIDVMQPSLLAHIEFEQLDDVITRWQEINNLGKRILIAGKNVAAFDFNFYKHESWAHRVLDPGTLYFDPKKDKLPPGTSDCIRRAKKLVETNALSPGVNPFPDNQKHNELTDAFNVVKMIRAWYGISFN